MHIDLFTNLLRLCPLRDRLLDLDLLDLVPLRDLLLLRRLRTELLFNLSAYVDFFLKLLVLPFSKIFPELLFEVCFPVSSSPPKEVIYVI